MRFVLVGGDSLLVQCGERLLALGHEIPRVAGSDRAAREWAERRGLRRVECPEQLATELARDRFDYLLSVANLAVLPGDLLRLAERGAVNFHDGPLPQHGGLNAPSWALLAGESEHAVTWHRMEARADAGDILVQRRFPIDPADSALALNTKCLQAGIASFDELLDVLERGAPGRPHVLDRASYHAAWQRPSGLGLIRWELPVAEVDALARALDFGPYRNPLCTLKLLLPGAHALVGRWERLAGEATLAPGTIGAVSSESITVHGNGSLVRLSDLAYPDGRPLAIPDACRRWRLETGVALPRPTDTVLAALDANSKAFARAEPGWVDTLARLDPIELPTRERAPADGESACRQELSPAIRQWLVREADAFDAIGAAAALFAVTLGGRREGDLAVAVADGVVPEEAVPLAGSWVPLRVRLEPSLPVEATLRDLAREVQAARRRLPYLADLWARVPQLRGRDRTLPIAITTLATDTDVVPLGAALTIGIGEDVVVWRSSRPGIPATEIAGRFEAFLDQLMRNPTQPTGTLHALTPAELALAVEQARSDEWVDLGDGTVSREFEARVALDPQATAAVFEDDSVSFDALNRRSNQLAHRLRALGVVPDQPVGICIERSLDLLVAVLGVLKAGGAYVPLDPAYPVSRLELMIADSAMKVVVAQAHLLDLVDGRASVVCLDRDRAELETLDPSNPARVGDGSTLAYVIYTSGSTGRPKGVMVEHRNVLNFFAAMDRRLGASPPGVWLAVTSLSFDISVLELLWTLTRGFKVVLYADENRVSSATLATNAHRPMDFSLFYFSAADDAEKAGQRDKYRLLLEGARYADHHGFTAVWTPERHFHSFGGLYPNPSVTGAAVAAVTRRVGIRAGSCVLPLHHPVRVAEEWAVVDNLSNGRVGLSVAAGWQPDDFVLRPESHADSKAAMFRDLETVRRLWRGETVTMPGPRGDVKVRCLPRPVQAELPIWVTTAGNVETFEAAGRVGASVLTHLLGQTVAEVEGKAAAYRRAWQAAGHAGDGYVTLMLHAFVGPDTDQVKERVRGPMKEYLKTSISLIRGFASAFPTFKRKDDALDFDALSAEEFEALLDYSFERYFETSGLFGDLDRCQAIVDQLKGIGVDEIACLIDFGVDTDTTIDHLRHLNRLRHLTAKPRATGDYSLATLIERHSVTHLQCTPSMAGMLLASDRTRDALRRLRLMLVGGEALTPALAEDLGRTVTGRVFNMYGPTETTVWSTCSEVVPDEAVSIGRPILNTEVFVCDPFQRPVPPGAEGELCIGGYGVARGYWGRPELTSERFVPDPRTPASRLYRTGDLARVDSTGTLQFLGRLDHQVKVRGFRIELGEIEALLGSHPAVREAAAVAREHGANDTRIIAYVVRRQDVDQDQLKDWLKARLPEYMIPAQVVFLPDLPRTPNLKIDRKALPAPGPLVAAEPRATSDKAHSALEREIATIWREALRIPDVSVDSNFFDLGGHSLLAVQVHTRLKKTLGRDLGITDLFRFPTIRGLARYLEAGDDKASAQAAVDRGAARRAVLERRGAGRSVPER